MKIHSIIFCMAILPAAACKDKPAVADKSEAQPTKVAEAPATFRWKEYKTISGTGNKDTLPFPECYMILTGNKLTYQREGKIIYIDSIYPDKDHQPGAFRFKDHTGDLLILSDSNRHALLKRDHYEGVYEYFQSVNK